MSLLSMIREFLITLPSKQSPWHIKRISLPPSHRKISYSIYFSNIVKVLCLGQAFFLTPPAEKTKTQGQNSSKKLKKKTQPLGGLSLPFAKLKKKTKFHETFSSKLKIFKGVALFTPFLLTNIFKNRKKMIKFAMICQNFKIFLEKE